MTVMFYTFGCKVNQYETQVMRDDTEKAGFETCEYTASGEACAVVVNSCTVTGDSDRKLRHFLRRVRREHPEAALVLSGCMPQAFPEQAATVLDTDIVLGNAARRELVKHLQNFLTMHCRIVEIPPHSDRFEAASIDNFQERTRAFVKIEDGCNRFCSYCIIPYARGRVRSKPLGELEKELDALACKGYSEVVLVGINLAAYGQDCGAELCDALDIACSRAGIRRVRLGSLEPDMLDAETIKRMSAMEKLCPQFHVSLQSGCDATLKRMNRRYTAAEYAEGCRRLRDAFPGCALTTDVMVGFPGEDENEFRQSLEFVRRIGFARTHVFAYSPRPGTPAASAENQVPPDVRAHRSREMIAVCDSIRDTYLETQMGSVFPVLIEKVTEDTAEGHTPQYIQVRTGLCGRHAAPGDIVDVRLSEHHDGVCVGECI